MPWVRVNADVVNILRGAAPPHIEPNGARHEFDDVWSLQLTDETMARVREHILPGETVCDALFRILTIAAKQGSRLQ